jgi:hypothetical protein
LCTSASTIISRSCCQNCCHTLDRKPPTVFRP